MINQDPLRWAACVALVAAYALMCLWLRARWRHAHAAPVDAAADWIVAFASQTGTGEFLAQQTLATLHTAGLAARACSLDRLGDADLRSGARILFIASTYGEGDPPDSAGAFARRLAAGADDLSGLHYGLLALGDSSYTHYCGFGRTLDAALQARHAQPLFARIEADRAHAGAIEAWQHHLSHHAGTSDAPDWSAPAYASWRLQERTLMNPGSAGAPVYRIGLVPADGALPDWEAGDLVQVSVPADPDTTRDYSIASIRAEGQVTLLVRLHLHGDGSLGAASGWLCRGALLGADVTLRLRAHQRFRLGENGARPLILVGNGTGIGGLRAHIEQRALAGQGRNWLLFGERHAGADHFCAADIARWQADGMLDALSLAFSRDGGEVRYVQDALAREQERLREWVAKGAAIYVCGSLQGMAGGVHAVLEEVLGADKVAALVDEGRYRRDVY